MSDVEQALRLLDEMRRRAQAWRSRAHAAEAKVARVEAAIRFVQPDHLTPMGAQMIRKALGGGE